MLYAITDAFLTLLGSNTSNTVLSLALHSTIKSSLKCSCVFSEYKSNVPQAMAEKNLRKLDLDPELTHLVEREDFILFNRHENFQIVYEKKDFTSTIKQQVNL
jgi:hypothetical protein